MARYEMVEDGHAKFWDIQRSGATVTVTFGRIGTAGQSKPKTHGSVADAEKAEQQLIAEKTKKGYQLVGGASPAQKNDPPAAKALAKAVAKERAKEAAPKKIEKPISTPKAARPSSDPRFDGSLNRFVNKSGEQVDLRVVSGDFPTSVRISEEISSADYPCYSPKGDRLALHVGRGFVIVVVDGKSPVDHLVKVDGAVLKAAAWAPDGSRLYVTANSEAGGYVVTFDPEGKELSRFKVAGAPDGIAVNPKDGSLVVSVDEGSIENAKDKGISLFDPSGKKKQLLSKYAASSGILRVDPSGTLVSYIGFKHVEVVDLEGKDLGIKGFEGLGDASSAWLGPRELLVFSRDSDSGGKRVEHRGGFYRVRFGAKGAEKPEFIGDFETYSSRNIEVSWDGRLIGIARNQPSSVIDIYDVAIAKASRHLRLPKGNSETSFAFAPDGRVSGMVNFQHVVHMFGQAPRFAVLARSAASEAAPRKSAEKYFDSDEAAQREAEKQVAALSAKGFSLASIDQPANEEEVERRDILRRIAASSLASAVRHALVPAASPTSNAAITARFRGAPSLGKGETHPACPSCKKPMTCLVEIDLESLPANAAVRGEGLLQVFWCESTKPHCEIVTSAWEIGEGKSKLARLFPKGSRKAGGGGKEVGAWIDELDVPNDTDDVERACGVALRKAVSTLKVQEDEWPEALAGDKLGGHPRWVQAPEYPSCPVCKGEMTELVLQLASNGLSGVQWQDMGIAYVVRCPKHVDRLELFSQSS